MGQNLFISSFRKLDFKIGFIAVLLCILFAIEITVRIAWDPSIIGHFLYKRLSPRYDLGFEVNTKIAQVSKKAIHIFPSTQFNFHYQQIDNLPDIKIIAFYGSSTIRGKADNNYPLYIQKEDRLHNNNIKSINLAADGIGSLRINTVLSSTAHINPALIVYHPHGSNEYEDERDYKEYMRITNSFSGILLNSRAAALAKRFIGMASNTMSEQNVDSESEIIASLVPENITRWNRKLYENIKKFVEHKRLTNVPIIVIGRVEQNLEQSTFNDTRVATINDVIKNAIADCKRCRYFDTVSVFGKYGNSKESRARLFIDNTHYTVLGHNIMAKELHPLIIELIMDADQVHF